MEFSCIDKEILSLAIKLPNFLVILLNSIIFIDYKSGKE
jgi:hypothetical protein